MSNDFEVVDPKVQKMYREVITESLKELEELRELALYFRIAHGGYPQSEARYGSVDEFIRSQQKFELKYVKTS